LEGVWAREASKKFSSNFKFGTQLGFGTSLPKTTFRTKIGGIWSRGASEKMWQPLLVSATIEVINFKFGTQLGFGEYITVTALIPNLVAAGWSTGAPQKLFGSGTTPCIT